MNPKTIAIFLITALIVGGGAFYGGMKYEQSQSPFAKFANRANGSYQGNATGTRNNAARMSGGAMTIGEIISKDDKSITVKLVDGGSKIIFLSDSTKTTKQAEGTADDLATGKQISFTGTANSDGSINAQSIQIMSSSTMPSIPESSGTQPPAAN